ncbi:MAG: translocation/assembly module TamB domain-containing protein [Bdellovibrionales bacterium]|nr:translocation/assembly module TamB domain-containing protein [Oligoflexia bacterium]
MKILKRVLLSIIGFVGLIVLIVVVVWLNPGVILTQSRIDQNFNKYAGSYFSKKPEHIQLTLDEFGFTGKKVRIQLSPFCLKDPDGCFSKVHFEFAFKLISFTKAKIEEIGPLEIINETLTWREVQKKEGPKNKPSASSWTDYLLIPTNLVIKDIDIEFPKFLFEQKDPIKGRFFARGKQSDKMNVRFDADGKGMKAQGSIDTAFVMNQENPFKALIAYEGKGTIQGNLHGAINWNNLSGNLEGKVLLKKVIPWVDSLLVDDLVVKRTDKITLLANLEAKIEPKFNQHNNDSALPKASFEPRILGKFEAHESNDNHVEYKVHLGPLNEKGVHLEAQVAGVYPFPKGEEYHYGLSTFLFSLDLPKFQTLVQSLRRTNSAVPAPFASMDGSVHLRVGNEDGAFKDTLPISFASNLDSKEQTLKTDSKGSVVFSPPPKKMVVQGTTQIQSFRFTLPDLDILAPAPGLKTDARIISVHQTSTQVMLKKNDFNLQVVQKEHEPSNMELNWKIRTSPSGIQIFYPILKPYAPVEVSWDIADEKSGEIKILPFTIEFLNRKAKVENLRYYINPDDPTFHYEGRIVVPKTEYTIYIDIIQDGEKPKIQMTSSPPLAESDIISVLLFNQTSAELDTSDTSSVASTQSAVANRALGIFTILTLSSTPVEAVNFNAATGVYSARVKLGQGLTATVGTDWDKSQEVALRKRLGRNFVLSTVFQTDQNTNAQTTKTLIEWFRRY